jgi:hypothetical protein
MFKKMNDLKESKFETLLIPTLRKSILPQNFEWLWRLPQTFLLS